GSVNRSFVAHNRFVDHRFVDRRFADRRFVDHRFVRFHNNFPFFVTAPFFGFNYYAPPVAYDGTYPAYGDNGAPGTWVWNGVRWIWQPSYDQPGYDQPYGADY